MKVIRKIHVLNLPACVIFARCQIWIVQQDDGIVQPFLLPTGVYVHVVYVEGILHEAFVCTGPIKYKNSCAVRMHELED